MLAALGLVPAGVTKINQRIEVRVGHCKHVATAATIAAVGAAKFFVLLMPERNAAVPAIACGDVNIGFVNEFHDVSSFYSSLSILILSSGTKKPRLGGALCAMADAV